MRHEDASEKLLELAYGELPPREARAVEAHARECAACGAELARMQGTRGVMARLAPEPAPEHGEGILLAAARQAAEQRGRRRRAPRWVWSGAIAAAAVLVVVISSRLVGISREPAALRDAPDAIAGGSGAREMASAAAPAEPQEKISPAAEPPRKLAKAEDAAQAGKVARADDAAPERFAAAPAQPPAAAPAPASPPVERRAAPARKAARDEDALAFAPPPPAAPSAADAAGYGRQQRADEAAAPAAAAVAAPAPRAEAEAEAPVARAEAKRAAPAPSAARAPASGAVAAAPGNVVWERSFPGCAGESYRRVERDALGRVLVYVRRGVAGGVPFEATLTYGPDGRLARVRYREGNGPERDVAGAAIRTGLPPGIAEPERAEDVLAAPPRCGV